MFQLLQYTAQQIYSTTVSLGCIVVIMVTLEQFIQLEVSRVCQQRIDLYKDLMRIRSSGMGSSNIALQHL